MHFDVNHTGDAPLEPVRPVRVLHGITSPETAHVVTDYPYGVRLRCEIRFWVERAARGRYKGMERMLSQTRDPRTGRWNNPRPWRGCTYAPLVVPYVVEGSPQRAPEFHRIGGGWLTPQRFTVMVLDGSAQQLSDAQALVWRELMGRALDDERRTLARGEAGEWSRWANAVVYGIEQAAETGEIPLPSKGSGGVGPYLVGCQYAEVYRAAVAAGLDIRGRLAL